jgi:hypothetical protein
MFSNKLLTNLRSSNLFEKHNGDVDIIPPSYMSAPDKWSDVALLIRTWWCLQAGSAERPL